MTAGTRRVWFGLLGIGTVCGCMLGSVPATADEAVFATVRLTSGSEARGVVDNRSNTQRLWLRSELPRSSIARGIAWEEVDRVTVDGVEWDRTAARRRLAAWGSTALGPLASFSPTSGESRHQPENLGIPPRQEIVATVVVEAALSRWGAGVEADGLIVWIVPLTEWGSAVPAEGTLEVELIGGQAGPAVLREAFPRLGRWVVALSANQWNGEAYQVRLPFQSVHPEWDTRVSAYGLVHARVSLPGHGTLDATTPATRIRAFNPIRDQLQQHRGTRYFAHERTGRGPQVYWQPWSR